MKRIGNTYTSPDIQNEIIKIMAIKILRKVSLDLQSSLFLTIMVEIYIRQEIYQIRSNKFSGLKILKYMKSFLVFTAFRQLILIVLFP